MEGKVPSKSKLKPLLQRSNLSSKYNLTPKEEPLEPQILSLSVLKPLHQPEHSHLRSFNSDGIVEQENSTIQKGVDLPLFNEVKAISPNLQESTFEHISEKNTIPKLMEHAESQISITNPILADKHNLKCYIVDHDISLNSTIQKHLNPATNIDDYVANVLSTPRKLRFRMGPILHEGSNENEASLPQDTDDLMEMSGSHTNLNNENDVLILLKKGVEDNLGVSSGQGFEVSDILGDEVNSELSNADQETFLCPLCWKKFDKNQSQISHMKSCATKHNISTQQLFSAIELLKKQNSERMALGLPRILNTTAAIKKTRKVPSYYDLADPNIQLALALSESIRDAEELKKLQEEDILMEAGLGEEIVEKQKSLLERFGFTSSRAPISSSDNNLRHRAGKKSTSTLLLRTNEERERLITEKVAIILMEEEDNQIEPTSTEEFQETPSLICNSNMLNNYHNKENELWTMACKEETTCEKYYVKNLEGIEMKRASQITCGSPTVRMQEIQTQQVSYTPLEAGTGLGIDWRKILNNITMSDITVHVKNELLIPAHKLVLFVRCPIILDDLVQEEDKSSGKMLEKLIWNNMSYEAVLAFLEYLYCGCVHNISNVFGSFSDLEWLSRRYPVEGLGQLLSEAIQTRYSNIGTDVSVDCNLVSPNTSVSGTCSKILKPFVHSSKEVLKEELEHSTSELVEGHSEISFADDSLTRYYCSPDLFSISSESMDDCKDVLNDNVGVYEENIEDILSIANSSNDLQVSCTSLCSPIKTSYNHYSPDSDSQSKFMDTITKRKYSSSTSSFESGSQKAKKLCVEKVASDQHNANINIECEVDSDDCFNNLQFQNELDSKNVCMKTANNNVKHTTELERQTPGSRLNEDDGTSPNKVYSEKCHNDSTNANLAKNEEHDDLPEKDCIDKLVNSGFDEGYVKNVWDDFVSEECMPCVALELSACNLPLADCISPKTLPREDEKVESHFSSELGINKLTPSKDIILVGKKSTIDCTSSLSLSQNSYFHQKSKINCSTPNSNSIATKDTLPGQFLDDPIPICDLSLTKSSPIHLNKSKSHNDLKMLDDSFNEQMNDSNWWKGVNVDSGSKQSGSWKPKPEPKCKSTPPISQLKISETEVTPMADYSGMETPHLKKELHKYGVKPLKRKQAKQILKHIYNELHPLVPLEQEGNGIQIESQQNKNPNSSEDILLQTACTMKELHSSSSQSSSNSDCMPDEEILEEPEICSPKTSQKNIETLPVVIKNLITTNAILHKQILLYEPIWLEKLHADVKAQQVKCKVDDVMHYLDQQCITYRTENGNAHHKKHKKVTKKSTIQ